jgi:hypothetical protein
MLRVREDVLIEQPGCLRLQAEGSGPHDAEVLGQLSEIDMRCEVARTRLAYPFIGVIKPSVLPMRCQRAQVPIWMIQLRSLIAIVHHQQESCL